MSYLLLQRDAVDFLRAIPDASVDLVITDPAYESLEKHRAVGTTTRLTKEWFPIFPNTRFEELFRELYRVLKNHSHLYVMCDAETMFVAKPIAEAAGFRFWKPLVWDKERLGMGYHYRARHEFVLFFEKGKRKLNDLSVPDVLRVKAIRGGYATEKPVALCDILVRQSSNPGELVLDPFAGSGSTGVAALRAGRRFWGADVQESALARATLRLAVAEFAASSGTPVDKERLNRHVNGAFAESNLDEVATIAATLLELERQNESAPAPLDDEAAIAATLLELEEAGPEPPEAAELKDTQASPQTPPLSAVLERELARTAPSGPSTEKLLKALVQGLRITEEQAKERIAATLDPVWESYLGVHRHEPVCECGWGAVPCPLCDAKPAPRTARAATSTRVSATPESNPQVRIDQGRGSGGPPQVRIDPGRGGAQGVLGAYPEPHDPPPPEPEPEPEPEPLTPVSLRVEGTERALRSAWDRLTGLTTAVGRTTGALVAMMKLGMPPTLRDELLAIEGVTEVRVIDGSVLLPRPVKEDAPTPLPSSEGDQPEDHPRNALQTEEPAPAEPTTAPAPPPRKPKRPRLVSARFGRTQADGRSSPVETEPAVQRFYAANTLVGVRSIPPTSQTIPPPPPPTIPPPSRKKKGKRKGPKH